MTMVHKFVPGALVPDRTLGARQVRGIASNGSEDRDGDIVLASGADLAAYRANPIVLAAHNPSAPIGTADVTRTANAIEATINFAPAGASKVADEFCALCKAGVVRALSIGFRPTDAEPRGNGRGFLFKAWELLEISLVAVPSNPNAVVMERAFGVKDGRVLAAQHADALMRAHRRIGAARQDVADVLKAAGHPPDDSGDPEADEPDEELAFLAEHRKRARLLTQLRGQGSDAEAARRKRLIAVAVARAAPLSAVDEDATARARLIERMRRGA